MVSVVMSKFYLILSYFIRFRRRPRFLDITMRIFDVGLSACLESDISCEKHNSISIVSLS